MVVIMPTIPGQVISGFVTNILICNVFLNWIPHDLVIVITLDHTIHLAIADSLLTDLG